MNVALTKLPIEQQLRLSLDIARAIEEAMGERPAFVRGVYTEAALKLVRQGRAAEPGSIRYLVGEMSCTVGT